jgi:hypothetical protein
MKTGKAIELNEKQTSQVEQQEFSSVNSVRHGNIQQPNHTSSVATPKIAF